MWDELPPGEEKRRRDFRRWGRFITEATAATGTLLLSATVFGTAAFFALRGSEMVVLPPEQILFYRDGAGDAAVLSVAFPARIINVASQDYGDVVRRVSLEISPSRRGTDAAFDYVNTIVEQTTTSPTEAAKQAQVCRLGVNCLAIEHLLVLEHPPDLLSFPGGIGRAENLGFVLAPRYCRGDGCVRFSSFKQVMASLRSDSALRFVLKLDFHSDGRTTATCSLSNLGSDARREAFDYLERHGWAELNCDRVN